MEIIILNTKVSVQSQEPVTKGNTSLSNLSNAQVTGNSSFNYLWVLAEATGLNKVTGINYIPAYYEQENMSATRFYKINKLTKAYSLIVKDEAPSDAFGLPRHISVDVDLAENEYIAIAGAMYYSQSNGNSFSYTINKDELKDNQNVNLWYNIEGFIN